MAATAGLVSLALVLVLPGQVPSPTAATRAAERFREEERAIVAKEATRLEALADRLKTSGSTTAVELIRSLRPTPPDADGSSRFLPLPEVTPARVEGLASVSPASGETGWHKELAAIRGETAKALFDLATRAVANPPRHYALADACLRGVVAREPDHAEARRLLGQVPHNGGWASPFAVRQFRDGKVLHPVYGWVWKSWVPHLERGELPGRVGVVEGKGTWLPAAEADALRSNFAKGWKIDTEHFHIETNVPLAEAITFGRHLEALEDLFEAMFADVIGENLRLAQRFKTKTLVGERAGDPPHVVSYYATREEFADALRAVPDLDAGQSLGYYQPPLGGRSRRGHAYFFRDQGGELDVTATLYHEVSHQLLFESGAASPGAYKNNVGNYWVFEGLGTYFETFSIRPDGSARVGGRVGPRLEAARKTLVDEHQMVPLDAFVQYGQNAFNNEQAIYKNYQQAAALTTFLMQAGGGKYRDAFLDYVRNACQGRLKRTSGRTLDDWLDVPYRQLENELRAYLTRDEKG